MRVDSIHEADPTAGAGVVEEALERVLEATDGTGLVSNTPANAFIRLRAILLAKSSLSCTTSADRAGVRKIAIDMPGCAPWYLGFRA